MSCVKQVTDVETHFDFARKKYIHPIPQKCGESEY